MKVCTSCRTAHNDEYNNCPTCGSPLQEVQPVDFDKYDHTSEFEKEDISQNKVVGIAAHMTLLGVIVALLCGQTSKFAKFCAYQALKIEICAFLCVLVAIIPVVGWVAGAVGIIVAVVLKIVCIIQICKGQAKEPYLVRELKFLK